MEGLTKRDKDLKIIPGLAERWETVDDGCAGASTCARTSSSTTARPSPPTT